ncbi:hypothetical protein D9756_006177 [Leucocoprinus leucothites]|uniref:Water stress and hypersensitive response domain-containing protein n=1 Tax=Leucocoprinus leucothites TaxID=201217 RepID=A0A8H5FWR2_9AGAR|nr:hypothetical protein D9756_006177 [Leucoagaricus leucothites]
MAQAFFFSIFALLFAAVFAVPTVQPRQFSPGDIINALGIGLVTDIHAFITPDSLTNNLISINFDVKNPLPIELTIKKISSSAGLNDTEFARFEHTFPSPGLVVGPLATKNSGTIDNVLVTQGVANSLDIIPLGVLDLLDTDADIQAATILGHLGFPVALDNLEQDDVPTTYNLTLA